MTTILQVYAPVALLVFALGTGFRIARLVAIAAKTRGRPRGRTGIAVDDVARDGFWRSLFDVITRPVRHYARKANPVWTLGYIFYHIGIITITAGYFVSVAILAVRILLGQPVPDVATHEAASHNYSLTNLVAIVFGNAEPLQAGYLFGPLAEAFVKFTWVIVGSAFFGNAMLLLTHLRGRGGAVTADMDAATRGVRTGPRHDAGHLLITLLVFAIIWTEILARLEAFPGIVYLHSLLGLTLFLIFPFTYLYHMFFAWLGWLYATRRRMARITA